MVAPPTILVIDDDPDIRSDLQMILEDQGYRVVCAPDGLAGLRLVNAERPDLVICDMMMPKMSGFIVLERVKTEGQLQVPFIMLTANESQDQRTLAEFLGADLYLNKPIGTKPLLDNLRRLCPPSRKGLEVGLPLIRHGRLSCRRHSGSPIGLSFAAFPLLTTPITLKFEVKNVPSRLSGSSATRPAAARSRGL